MSPRLQHHVTFAARLLTPLYTIAICILSLMPGRDVPLSNISDKYRHAAAYGVFAVLLATSFLPLRFWSLLIAFVVASLVGIAMEIIQPYFGRDRDVWDAVANSTGAAIGCAVVSIGLLAITTSPRPLSS